MVGEGTERRGFDGPDAPQADLVSLGINAARFERYGIAQANEVGECRCNALAGDVGVRVRVKEGDTRTDQPRHDCSLRVGDRQEGRSAQEQRVVRDHHVVGMSVTIRSGDGLLGDGGGRVEGQEKRAYGGVRVADDQANAIPGLRRGLRVPGLHEGHEVADAPRGLG